MEVKVGQALNALNKMDRVCKSNMQDRTSFMPQLKVFFCMEQKAGRLPQR